MSECCRGSNENTASRCVNACVHRSFLQTRQAKDGKEYETSSSSWCWRTAWMGNSINAMNLLSSLESPTIPFEYQKVEHIKPWQNVWIKAFLVQRKMTKTKKKKRRRKRDKNKAIWSLYDILCECWMRHIAGEKYNRNTQTSNLPAGIRRTQKFKRTKQS